MMPPLTDIAYWQEQFYNDLYDGWNSTVYVGNKKKQHFQIIMISLLL